MIQFPFVRSLTVVALAATLAGASAGRAAAPAAAVLDRGAVNCAIAKMSATLRESSGFNSCFRRALTAGVGVDPTCLQTAQRSLVTAFGKIDAKGGCSRTGDVAAANQLVEQFETQLAQEVLSNECLAAGSECGGVLVPCCQGLVCQGALGQQATCR